MIHRKFFLIYQILEKNLNLNFRIIKKKLIYFF
jgi:hypothetical protein